VALSDGAWFGAGFEGYARLNFATSKGLLTEIVERMARAVRGR
jgi:cystathionine beta-lyase